MLPSWQTGDVARNLGTILGFTGAWSLVPLTLMLTTFGLAWRWLEPRHTATTTQPVISSQIEQATQ
ncbi:MAG: hypothetical protein R2873_33230 [Caldilineaceae bacterium]